MPAPIDASDEPRTVVIPIDSEQVADYLIPPGILQYIQAVLIQVDNGGGPDVRPTLRIKEQSGVVIAAKRQGESIPSGDTGTATWALRLTDEQPAAASGDSGGLATRIHSLEGDVQSIDPFTLTPVRFNSFTVNALGVTTADWEIFTVPSIGANPHFLVRIALRVNNSASLLPVNMSLGGPGNVGQALTLELNQIDPGGGDYYFVLAGDALQTAIDTLMEWSLYHEGNEAIDIVDRRASITYIGQYQ